jgi:hypothetical protein
VNKARFWNDANIKGVPLKIQFYKIFEIIRGNPEALVQYYVLSIWRVENSLRRSLFGGAGCVIERVTKTLF